MFFQIIAILIWASAFIAAKYTDKMMVSVFGVIPAILILGERLGAVSAIGVLLTLGRRRFPY